MAVVFSSEADTAVTRADEAIQSSETINSKTSLLMKTATMNNKIGTVYLTVPQTNL